LAYCSDDEWNNAITTANNFLCNHLTPAQTNSLSSSDGKKDQNAEMNQNEFTSGNMGNAMSCNVTYNRISTAGQSELKTCTPHVLYTNNNFIGLKYVES
jgi:hypothetical protein